MSPAEGRTKALESYLLRKHGISMSDLASQDQASITLKVCGAKHVEQALAKFLTTNSEMLEMLRKAKTLALLKDPVIITGPSGVGKEIIAQAMHGTSTGDFLPLNCAAFSESLLESDLFGHEKGAFTDAKTKKLGALVEVGDGTVFLDEVDRMPIALQSKLLRAIENNEVRAVGSSKLTEISCRFIASAKEDLLEKVHKHQFLPDLYGRLMTFRLTITGLEQRTEDIPHILSSELRKVFPKENYEKYLEVPDSYLPMIYRFNVRALLSYVRHCVVFKEVPLV